MIEKILREIWNSCPTLPLRQPIDHSAKVNKFKQISLLFASFFILLFSVVGKPFSSAKSSIQNKDQDQSISAMLVGEVDDALDTDPISNPYQLHFIQHAVPLASLRHQPLPPIANFHFASVPFYLKIQNLRIWFPLHDRSIFWLVNFFVTISTLN